MHKLHIRLALLTSEDSQPVVLPSILSSVPRDHLESFGCVLLPRATQTHDITAITALATGSTAAPPAPPAESTARTAKHQDIPVESHREHEALVREHISCHLEGQPSDGFVHLYCLFIKMQQSLTGSQSSHDIAQAQHLSLQLLFLVPEH